MDVIVVVDIDNDDNDEIDDEHEVAIGIPNPEVGNVDEVESNGVIELSTISCLGLSNMAILGLII